jgi:hypothetical protein
VEAKKQGVASVGIEANPMAAFASRVKTTWTVDPAGLVAHARLVVAEVERRLEIEGVHDVDYPGLLGSANGRTTPQLRALPEEGRKLILTDSISPRPLHKVLVLLEVLEQQRDEHFYDHERLALAKSVVFSTSNLHFGPEVGVGQPKDDARVLQPWLAAVQAMAEDLPDLSERAGVSAVVHQADARHLSRVLEPASIDGVITSPPYPNEKDYTRTTRLETVLLGFARNKKDLQAIKRGLVRSNTRTVYKGDDDDQWVRDHPLIQQIAESIEARRMQLGKTSGFERLYHKVTKLYFGGMARHLAELRPFLKPGAQLAYVVGDQASYLRVMIRTGELLAQIGESLGYERVGIDLFRTRLATATKEHLREEAVILRWPG